MKRPAGGGEKSCTWVAGTCFGIRKAKSAEGGHGRKERLRIDGFPQGALSVP